MRVIGHRGAAARAPENTLPSFLSALEAGIADLECDARLTRDGVVVVMHDDDVSRTTGGTGRISEMSAADVRALDASAAWEGWSQEPARVPTLGELLEVIDGRARLVIELKADLDERGFRSAAPVALAVLEQLAPGHDVILSSFDPAAVAVVRERAPHLPTALSILRGFPIIDGIDHARAAGHAEVHPAQDGIDAATVARAHDAGVAICGWTVNDVERARILAALGVDGIFCDDPAGIRAGLLGA